MIKNLSKETRMMLVSKIDNFIRDNKMYKGKKARIKFAEEVNQLLGIENFDDQVNYKKVSRWITGETFPDFITIIAIAKVMNVKLDELFNNKATMLTKINELNQIEKFALKKIIHNIKKTENNLVKMYFPYSFNEKQINCGEDLLTREEVVKMYREKAGSSCRLNRLHEYNKLVKDIDGLKKDKHFERFCSVEFVENMEAEEKESIFYTNTEAYYKEISKIWEKTDNNDYYNVIFFEERLLDYTEKEFEIEKANYYKSRSTAKKIFNKYFASLIEKGFITCAKPQTFCAEWEDGVIEKSEIKMDNVISIFTDSDYDYTLETIRFSFQINMSKTEMFETIMN